jgi:hypothetical protein
MVRLNKPEKSDNDSLMTMDRAQQYINAAKKAYPTETLKNLAVFQQNVICRTSDGKLKGAIEMSPEELTDCLMKCRQHGFSNCDMQALEMAMHLKFGLGISNLSIVSNRRLSHNYVLINPHSRFPKGALVDVWTGQGLLELTFRTKLRFQHREANCSVNQNMHDWLDRYGSRYCLTPNEHGLQD